MNIEKYNKIHNELMNRLDSGEITTETAKEVNDLAFEKYIAESGDFSTTNKKILEKCAKLLVDNEPDFIHPKDMKVNKHKDHEYFRVLGRASGVNDLYKYFTTPVESIYSYKGKEVFAYIHIIKKTDKKHLLYFKLSNSAFEKFKNFYMAYSSVKTNSPIEDEVWDWINKYIEKYDKK